MWSHSQVDDPSYHRALCFAYSNLSTQNVCTDTGNVGKCITAYAFTVRCVLDTNYR